MFGLGRPKRPKIVAFDIIGTIFPLEPLRSSFVALGLPPAGLEGWFAAGCRDAFAMAAVGDFAPFTTVLEAALDQVLVEQGLDAPTGERKASSSSWRPLVRGPARARRSYCLPTPAFR